MLGEEEGELSEGLDEDHHTKAVPLAGEAEILLTFGPMLSDAVLAQAQQLRWIQALGTGVDNLVDLPSLRPDTIVTSMHGTQAGDPLKAAAAIDTALNAERTPLRLQLGEDAIAAIRQHAQALLAELEAWKTVGTATKFDGDGAGSLRLPEPTGQRGT